MTRSMGRFIDALDDDALDNLMTAEDLSDGGWWEEGCGCLVGTAYGMGEERSETWAATAPLRWAEQMGSKVYPKNRQGVVVVRSSFATSSAAYRYPLAVERRGKERVVRAIKLRVARRLQERGLRVPVEWQQEEVAV